MIRNYFKIALRNFGRHKVFTFINVIGLSIGISAAIVFYLIIHFDFTFDKFHQDGDRIYRIVTNFSLQGDPIYNGGVTGQLPQAVKNEVTGLKESASFYTAGTYNVLINDGQKTTSKFKNQNGVIYADGSYFNIIQYKWLAGSPKTALNGPHMLVLTSQQAKKYFPSLTYNQMIGRTVVYDSIKTVVTGVVQEFTENTDFTFHDFISFSTIKGVKDIASQLNDWRSTNGASQLLVKLNPGTSVQHIEKQLNVLLKKYNPVKPEDKGNTQSFALQPLSDLHFNDKYYAFDNPVVNRTTLYGLMIITLFLLILGCINFINLNTAQGAQRAKEIGVRKTMGSSRKQLILQFLSETFLVTLFAVIVSVCLSPLMLKLFADFVPKGITIDYLNHPDLIFFLFVLTIFVSVLSGFYPAIILSAYKPVSVLKNQAFNNKSQTRNAWLRKGLTVTQFIIAQFFIMATIMVSKQIYYAMHKDLGFKKDAIVFINTPWKIKDNSLKQVFFNKIKAIPQIEMVSIGNDIPSSNGWSSRDVTYKDGKKEIKADVNIKEGDGNYIPLYKIKLLAGRNIKLSDSASGLLINSTYAHLLGFTDVKKAIGISLPFSEKHQMQVIGVMSDFHQSSLHAPVKPLAFLTNKNSNFGVIHIALKPETAGGGEWKKAIASMQAAWKQTYREDDFEYHFFDETIARFYDREQQTSKLLAWATGLSIFISCLGLLGLAMHSTNLRTKEIGVRKVLGATVTQIVTLLSTEMLWLIMLAFVIVTPLAWIAMNQWMQSFSDRTSISWWIFALSGAGMLLAALFTSSFQTVKAAIANPVKSLRSE